MSNHYSSRSRGQINDNGPQVPSYSEAMDRNLIELRRSTNTSDANGDSSQNVANQTTAISREDPLVAGPIQGPSQRGSSQQHTKQGITRCEERSSQTDGASHRDSSQIYEGGLSRESIMNADHQNPSQAELQELRIKDAVNSKIIKLLPHELNVKDHQIQQLNEAQKKTIVELTNQMAKSREIYDEQIKNLAVIMASITKENRNENEQAIEMLSSQMAEVMHLLENKQ